MMVDPLIEEEVVNSIECRRCEIQEYLNSNGVRGQFIEDHVVLGLLPSPELHPSRPDDGENAQKSWIAYASEEVTCSPFTEYTLMFASPVLNS